MLSNKIVTCATIIVYSNSFDQKQVVLYTDTLECRLLLNRLPQLMSGISSSSVSSLSGKWGEAKMHHTVLIRDIMKNRMNRNLKKSCFNIIFFWRGDIFVVIDITFVEAKLYIYP